MAASEFIKVRNVNNGGIYLLRMSKINKEIGEWEQVFENEPTVVAEVPEVGGSIEPSYGELKEMLKALGIEFRGNAPKEELMKLYEETI